MINVEKYRLKAHSDGFRYEPTYLKLSEQFELRQFLKTAQFRTKPVNSRHSYYSVLSECAKILKAINECPHNASEELEIVLKRSSINVTRHSSISGFWTHLIFISGNINLPIKCWKVYGYARCRLGRSSLSFKMDSQDDVYSGCDVSFVNHTEFTF